MTETNRKKLGHGLRVSRVRAKVESRDAADHIGVTVDTIRRWERGESSLPADSLFELAELYRTTVEAIGRDGGIGCGT
jgi:transcriptional regulator with XRE-family HTH domain